MIDFLIQQYNITKSEAQLFFDSFEILTLKKGEIFIEYGKVNNKVGFVEKGLLKCTLIGKEKSVIDDFVFENQFVANYVSFLEQQISNKEIACLQNSILKVISRQKLNELAKDYSFIEKIARQVSEQLLINTSKKLEDLRLLNAEERYLQLVKTNKIITNEIPQYEIASYLNVSPETVSRIRKKLGS